MKNISSDTNYSDENDQNDEGPVSLSSENTDVPPLKDSPDIDDNTEPAVSQTNNDESVAEKVEGVHNIEGHEDNNDDHIYHHPEDYGYNDSHGIKESDNNNHHSHQPLKPALEPANPEELIQDWEHLHNTILPKKLRKFALLVASLNMDEDKGITVDDIKVLKDCKRDAAEGRIHKAVAMGLLMPHQTLKEGKQKQYFISNYIHVINEKIRERTREQVSPDDITLTLVKVLSERRSAYHRISLLTKLKYPEEDYDRLTSNNWSVISEKNKTKTATFKLEHRRNCSLNISPNGTIMISIECTTKQYKLHTGEGIAELFVSCGQILGRLQQEAGNRLNVVPSVIDWEIGQFDNDKTISIAELEKEYPKINWHAKGVLKIRLLGSAFQLYEKEMLEVGPSLRSEINSSSKFPKKIIDKVKETAKGIEEETPEDFITKARQNKKRNNKVRNDSTDETIEPN